MFTLKAFLLVWDIVFSQRFLCEGQSREGKLLKGLRRSNLNPEFKNNSEISTLTYVPDKDFLNLEKFFLFDHNDMNSQLFCKIEGNKVVIKFTISARGHFCLHSLQDSMSNHLI